jgi:hypothetical protein
MVRCQQSTLARPGNLGILACLRARQHHGSGEVMVALNGGVPVVPGTRGQRKITFTSESFLVSGVLQVIACHQMGKIVIINVSAMEFLRGGAFERVGRGLVKEGSQELSFAICQRHD